MGKLLPFIGLLESAAAAATEEEEYEVGTFPEAFRRKIYRTKATKKNMQIELLIRILVFNI